MMMFAAPVFAMGMTADGASPLLQLVPFALILGIFYFIILLPAKRKQQKVQEFLDSLKVNDRVITMSRPSSSPARCASASWASLLSAYGLAGASR